MNKINYNVALISFYQVKKSYNGAAEVSLSLFKSISCLNKKLFEIKNPKFFFKNQKLINFINSYFLKPFKIGNQFFLLKKFFKNKKKKMVIVEGASWIGYSFFFIKILRIIEKNVIIIYHAHNIEYEIRKIKSNRLIILLSKYFEKKVYEEADFATVVSKIDQKKIFKLYKKKPTIFFNGVSKCRLKIKKVRNINYKYIIFSGNYFYYPNQIAIEKLTKVVIKKISKKFKNIKLIITGSELPEKIFYNNKDIIFMEKVNKMKLNYLIKKSICTILPLIKSPGTKLKVIEALLLGKIIIGSKQAFEGIDCLSLKPPFIYKNLTEIIYYLNILLKKTTYYNIKANETKKYYQEKYLMENIWNKFCIEKSII